MVQKPTIVDLCFSNVLSEMIELLLHYFFKTIYSIQTENTINYTGLQIGGGGGCRKSC